MKSSPFATMMALVLVTTALLGFADTKRSRAGLGIWPELAPFTAGSDRIQAGDSTTLTWVTRGAESVILETIREKDGVVTAEVQRGLPPAGSRNVTPRETATFRMWCVTAFSCRGCERLSIPGISSPAEPATPPRAPPGRSRWV